MKSFLIIGASAFVMLGCGLGASLQPKLGYLQEKQSPAAAEQGKVLQPKDLTETAPATFKAKFETTKGDFTMEFYRDWSPNGVDRFYNLVKNGYFQDIAIFRAVDNFMFQFGIHGDPEMNKVWSEARIKDDPDTGHTNAVGTISFAKGGADSRSVQLFISLTDNRRLDAMGFTPLGKVVENAAILGKINTEYGENSRDVQGNFQAQGNAYVKEKFPNLDYIKSITLVTEEK
ncbi:MAG: peptidylprolyl isomerase [Pirellulaceae bacterium]